MIYQKETIDKENVTTSPTLARTVGLCVTLGMSADMLVLCCAAAADEMQYRLLYETVLGDHNQLEEEYQRVSEEKELLEEALQQAREEVPFGHVAI